MCLLRRPFPHLSMQLPHSSSTSPSPVVFSPLHRQHRGFGTPPVNPHRGLEALAPPACSQKCPHSVQSPVLFGLWSTKHTKRTTQKPGSGGDEGGMGANRRVREMQRVQRGRGTEVKNQELLTLRFRSYSSLFSSLSFSLSPLSTATARRGRIKISKFDQFC